MTQFTQNLAFLCSNFITFLELESKNMKKASFVEEWMDARNDEEKSAIKQFREPEEL